MLTIDKNNFEKWELLLRVLSEEIRESDAAFQAWLQEDENNRQLFQSLKKGVLVGEPMPDKDEMYENIAAALFHNRKNPPFYKKAWFGYTAVLLVTFISGLGAYLAFDGKEQPEQAIAPKEPKDIFAPGSKNAYLLSSQGDTIDLSKAFEVAKKDGTVISNNTRGIVSIEKKRDEKAAHAEYHTIYVPRGGEYTLVLADGSTAYLNSETRLTFPSYFDGSQRMVQLAGEAYFEVQTDSKPFVVQAGEMQIKALGTSFNVNAYQDNSYANATLVEGSVEIQTGSAPEPLALKPGENLNFEKSSRKISINRVNTSLYTSWVKGIFVFRNQPLSEIFAQLRRWYNFEIVYENPAIPSMRFTGSAEKARPLHYLLDQIQSVTDVKYTSRGDRIVLY